MPSQLFQFFMSYLLARFDISLATLLGVHQGLGITLSISEVAKNKLRNMYLNYSHMNCVHALL